MKNAWTKFSPRLGTRDSQMTEKTANPFKLALGGDPPPGSGATLDALDEAPIILDDNNADLLPEIMGNSLGTTMFMNKIHPVLIFGTAATGKTTFLTSMLSFFTSMPDVGATVTLGDRLSDSEAGTQAHESAEKIFHQRVNEYLGGKAPTITQDLFPFFIPLELRKTGNRFATKVALMESSGELWSVQNAPNNVQILRTEILDVYRTYPKPLSVIIVVPYAMSEGYTGQDTSETDKDLFRISDASLLQTLEIYQRHRPEKIKDQFYFVLTKWDMHTSKIASKDFIQPSEELVGKLIEDRFPRAFNFFRAMSNDHQARCTPYSAGLIGGTKVLEVPAHLRPLLHEFPYRLWRWIYATATDGDDLYSSNIRPKGGRVSRFFWGLFS